MRSRPILLLVALLYVTGLARDGFDRWVDGTVVPNTTIETSVEVRDANDVLLRAFTVSDGRWRLHTRLEDVDPTYVDMLVRYEDKRFFQHRGVDVIAFTRAVGQALWNGRVVSGGSTLSMQVARLLEDGPTGTWTGKIRQIRVALALERSFSKSQILELYFNRAPFGGNLEGLRSASLAYFRKEPSRLTAAESALLVAIPQSPERRRPDLFKGTATDARKRVLERTLKQDDERRLTASEPVPHKRHAFPMLAPHTADLLRRSSPGIGMHRTSLDASLQARLEELAKRSVKSAGADTSIALMAANHQTGEIIASVGSSDLGDQQRSGFVDMTMAVRSPGSTLKPLVYGLAFDQGFAHPETLLADRPMTFADYAPQNFDGAFRGDVKAKDALLLSLNLPVVALTEALGPARLLVHLRRAGLEPRFQGETAGLAIALGGVGLTLRDLVQLYAGFANHGQSVTLSVTPRAQSRVKTVLSRRAAWQITDILSQAAAPDGAGTAGLAYKTGTSYGHRDAWAIGYDGQHVVGVWMGRPDGTPVPGAFGGKLASPVLFEAFAIMKPELHRHPPPPPDTLLVSHAQLPSPLKRFPADGLRHGQPEPSLAFPPNGAVLQASSHGFIAKVRDGTAPFTWLINGELAITSSYDRQVTLNIDGPGFLNLTVIDVNGQSSRSDVRIIQ